MQTFEGFSKYFTSCCCINTIVGFQISSILLVLEIIERNNDVSHSVLMEMHFVYFISCFIGQIFMGFVGDLLGRRPTWFLGSVFIIVGSLLCALSFSEGFLLQFTTGLAISGIGTAGLLPLSFSVLCDAVPQHSQRILLMAICSCFQAIGHFLFSVVLVICLFVFDQLKNDIKLDITFRIIFVAGSFIPTVFFLLKRGGIEETEWFQTKAWRKRTGGSKIIHADIADDDEFLWPNLAETFDAYSLWDRRRLMWSDWTIWLSSCFSLNNAWILGVCLCFCMIGSAEVLSSVMMIDGSVDVSDRATSEVFVSIIGILGSVLSMTIPLFACINNAVSACFVAGFICCIAYFFVINVNETSITFWRSAVNFTLRIGPIPFVQAIAVMSSRSADDTHHPNSTFASSFLFSFYFIGKILAFKGLMDLGMDSNVGVTDDYVLKAAVTSCAICLLLGLITSMVLLPFTAVKMNEIVAFGSAKDNKDGNWVSGDWPRVAGSDIRVILTATLFDPDFDTEEDNIFIKIWSSEESEESCWRMFRDKSSIQPSTQLIEFSKAMNSLKFKPAMIPHTARVESKGELIQFPTSDADNDNEFKVIETVLLPSEPVQRTTRKRVVVSAKKIQQTESPCKPTMDAKTYAETVLHSIANRKGSGSLPIELEEEV